MTSGTKVAVVASGVELHNDARVVEGMRYTLLGIELKGVTLLADAQGVSRLGTGAVLAKGIGTVFGVEFTFSRVFVSDVVILAFEAVRLVVADSVTAGHERRNKKTGQSALG